MQSAIKISFFFLVLISSVNAEQKWSWSKLKVLESKMEKWKGTISHEDFVKIGKMKQRPDEVEIIRAFFPYLLPKEFVGQKIDMECYPSFTAFQKERDQENYDKWESCLNKLYRKEKPEILKEALEDLRP